MPKLPRARPWKCCLEEFDPHADLGLHKKTCHISSSTIS